MTLGPAVRVLAAQAAKHFPNSMADACRWLLAECKDASHTPPANPAEFIKTWRARVTSKGDIISKASRSGRPAKLTDAKVQAAYKAMLAWEKAGRDRPYESAEVAAAECAYVKQLLAKTGAKFSTLLARIRVRHPRFGRHKLRVRWHMSGACQQERLAKAQELLTDYSDKLDFVVHLDAKTVYLQEKVIYGYVDLDVGYTVSYTTPATKKGKVIKLRYYAAVNAKLGAFSIIYYTGTTDMPANRPGAHYKVGSVLNSVGLPPPITCISASLSCAAHTLAVRLKLGSSSSTHNHSTLQPVSTAALAYAVSLHCRVLMLSSVVLGFVTSLLLCPCTITSTNSPAGVTIARSHLFRPGYTTMPSPTSTAPIPGRLHASTAYSLTNTSASATSYKTFSGPLPPPLHTRHDSAVLLVLAARTDTKAQCLLGCPATAHCSL